MADDGFPERRDFYYQSQGKLESAPVLVAVAWSKMALLREVANMNEMVMVCGDTVLPYGFLHDQFIDRLKYLTDRQKDFKGLFLGCIYQDDVFVDVPHEAFPNIEPTYTITFYRLPHCWLPFSMIITPQGAAEILELWREKPYNTFQGLLYRDHFNLSLIHI